MNSGRFALVSATRELLADRYHLEERIATGGMGVVWRARDHRLGRDVAVKLIRPEYADDPTFRQRLRLEARAIAAISSPHVVRIHDVCEEDDPTGGCRAFIVMELVDGEPLSRVLGNGPLAPQRTAQVIAQAASALAAAHEQQIIHRDVKPANLMLDTAGRVVVLDFGIARAADGVALTATDLILGTARYISPEQADGRGATAASDVYSLGVVAFQCLTGEVPFDAGSDVAVALAHLREPIPELPSHIPGRIAALVRQMLAKAPDERPAAAEVASEFAVLSAAVNEPVEPTAALAVPAAAQPVPSPTAVMPVALAVHHRIRDRLAGRDLRDTSSAALPPPLLIIPAAVILFVLMIVAALSGGSGGLQPSAAAAAARASHSHAHVTPKVTIDPTHYIGRPWPDVRRDLLGLGVSPNPEYAGDGAGGRVVGLAPTGRVRLGATITVVVARSGPAKPPKPAKPAHGPGGHVPPGQAKKHPAADDHGD
jgi:serine/threonine-protein kinase